VVSGSVSSFPRQLGAGASAYLRLMIRYGKKNRQNSIFAKNTGGKIGEFFIKKIADKKDFETTTSNEE
jgi:hypothetical protein